jgi:hypothetical protein
MLFANRIFSHWPVRLEVGDNYSPIVPTSSSVGSGQLEKSLLSLPRPPTANVILFLQGNSVPEQVPKKKKKGFLKFKKKKKKKKNLLQNWEGFLSHLLLTQVGIVIPQHLWLHQHRPRDAVEVFLAQKS